MWNEMAILHRLFIGGLFPDITETILEEKLSRFGTVSDVEIKTRSDDDGKPIKTFAHLNLEAPENNIKKLMSTLNKTRWKGSELQIQKAKESFLKRLERERVQQAAASEPPPSLPQSPLAEVAGVDNFQLKGAKPGTPVPGVKNWVVGKYSRVLPIMNMKKEGHRKPVKIDPSKYCHSLKKFKDDEDSSTDDVSISQLTWMIEEPQVPGKRKADVTSSESSVKKRKTQLPPPSSSNKNGSMKKSLNGFQHGISDNSDFEEVAQKIPDKSKQPQARRRKACLTFAEREMEKDKDSGNESASSADTDEILRSSQKVASFGKLFPHKLNGEINSKVDDSVSQEQKHHRLLSSEQLDASSKAQGSGKCIVQAESGHTKGDTKSHSETFHQKSKRLKASESATACVVPPFLGVGMLSSSADDSGEDDSETQLLASRRKKPKLSRERQGKTTPVIPPFLGSVMMSDSDEDDACDDSSAGEEVKMPEQHTAEVTSRSSKSKCYARERKNVRKIEEEDTHLSSDTPDTNDDDDDDDDDSDDYDSDSDNNDDDDDSDDDNSDEKVSMPEISGESQGRTPSQNSKELRKLTPASRDLCSSPFNSSDSESERSNSNRLDVSHNASYASSVPKQPTRIDFTKLDGEHDTKWSLFNSSSDEEEGLEKFSQPRFEGRKGVKVMKMQKMIGSDPRFQIGQEFLPSDEDADSDGEQSKKKDEQDDEDSFEGKEDLKNLSLEDEKARNLKILEGIVGVKKLQRLEQKLERQRKNRQFLTTSYQRYEPSPESDEETAEKPAQTKVKKTGKKKTEKQRKEENGKTEDKKVRSDVDAKKTEKQRKEENRKNEEEEVKSDVDAKNKADITLSEDSSDVDLEGKAEVNTATEGTVQETKKLADYFRDAFQSDSPKKPFSLFEVLGEEHADSASEGDAEMPPHSHHGVVVDSSSEEEETPDEPDSKQLDELVAAPKTVTKDKAKCFLVSSLEDPRLRVTGIFDTKEGPPTAEYLDWWHGTRPERVAGYKKKHKEAKRKERKVKEKTPWNSKGSRNKRKF